MLAHARRAAVGLRRATLRIERLESRNLLSRDGVSPPGRWMLDDRAFEADSILVRFDAGHRGVAAPLAALQGAAVARRYSAVPGLTKLVLYEGASLEQTLSALRSSPHVLYAEPDYRISVSAVPDDPRFAELWGLNNDGQTGGTADADIDAAEAWDFTTGSGDTIVAVIDTGVDYLHEDLAANIWTNPGEIAGDGIDNDGNGYVDDVHGYDFANRDGDPMDDHNHGTHVAGTIGAVAGNGVGVAGVNWNVQIMAVKFLDATGNGSISAAVDALDYAVANGATISNNSWGYNGGYSQALYDAIARARDADHIFVAAAGNGNILGIGQNNDATPFYPSSYDLDNIVAVAALDHNDSRAVFSNFGAASVDLGAPGVNILSTVRNNGYSAFNGTSMATPHVAGVVALLRDFQPALAYDQVIGHIFDSVDPVASLQSITTTGGRLNAASVLQQFAAPAPEIQVLAGSKFIADDTGVFDFGDWPPTLPVDQVFTVRNVGLEPLTLAEPISVPPGYSLAASFDRTTLAHGEATSFTLRLEAESVGVYAGEVAFANNDENENPFNFTVTANVAIPPPVRYVDNGDAGFATVGAWSLWTNQGFQGDIHESQPGDGSDVASWTFDRLLSGYYRVSATWSAYTNRATNAPFTIYAGETPIHTELVNQRNAPGDFTDAGVGWDDLGFPVAIDGTTLTVTLTDAADGRLNADAIRIERLEDYTPNAEITVAGPAGEIADDVGQFDFGEASLGIAVVHSFTVTNVGSLELTLGEPISLPAGFSLAQSFAAASLAPGASTSFAVRLDADTEGAFSGELSFTNSDADENPFNFAISGSVADLPPPPVVAIVDDGDAGFTTVGPWNRWTNQGYQGDIHENFAGTGADIARWTFDSLQPGVYRVSATWSAYANRATNAPFTLFDGTTAIRTEIVNQQVAPGDFSDAGANWDDLGLPIEIAGTTLAVQLSDAANGRLNADAIRIERLENYTPAPEIAVSGPSGDIADDVGQVDFGEATLGAPIVQTFTVKNTGTQDLTLVEPIALPAGYSLVQGFAATSLAPGASTTFSIQLDAGSVGAFSGEVSFANNDADENPFNFTITGNVTALPPPPAAVIIDDGDAGFTTVGVWNRWANQGFQGDIHENFAGTGADVASWTFDDLQPGVYRVSATWTAYGNRASNSPFTLFDGATPIRTEIVNQRIAPSDFADAGVNWDDLGAPVEITGTTLVVQLSDNANGRLNADAIRVERQGGDTPAPEISVTATSGEIADDVGQVDFGETAVGTPVPQTFTVTNAGTDVLTLGEAIALPAGFSLLESFATTSLAPGASTTFSIQLDADAEGAFSGEVSFANNDADENPFNFTITGNVASLPPPPAAVIIDNGDAGFTTVGPWNLWLNQGFQGDIHENFAGTGADVASWTFAGLEPGVYRVSATWTPYSNRASDAPFTLLDGATPIRTELVNQRVAPSGFADAGVNWNDLGAPVAIAGTTLVVQLSDNANGRLNADAIRIERTSGATSAQSAPASMGGQSIAEPTPPSANQVMAGAARAVADREIEVEEMQRPMASDRNPQSPSAARRGFDIHARRRAVDEVLTLRLLDE